MNPHDHTKAAMKYFLSKGSGERFLHYIDQGQSSSDLSSVIDSIREDLYDPIREEEAIKDMIICTAMEPEFLKYVSTKYRSRVTSEAVKQNGEALEYTSAELRGDREIVLEAVKNNGRALFYASAELQGDREIVLAAVKQRGGILEYALAEYQRDPEIIRASYLSSPVALKYSKGIHSYDPMFIFECLNRDARGLFYLNRREKEDLFNKLSLDLRRRIDYLSSVLGNSDEDYFFDYDDNYVSGDELEKIIDVRYLEFIEKTQKRALNELADMFSCELFYDDERQNDLHKQLQISDETKELSEIGATIASYLSVKEAVSTMRVCKSGLFSKGLSDAECQGNTNKYRKIND